MVRIASLLLILLGFAAPAQAAERAIDLLDVPVSYTAQFTVSGDKGSYSGTVWHESGRERRDFETKGGSQRILLRRDTDSAYLMKPANRWYVGLGFEAVGQLAGGIDSLMVERKRVGEQSIAGVRTVRYKVTATGPKGARFDGDAWFSKDDAILVRAEGLMTGPDGRTSRVETALSGLKVGPVSEQVFELPAGWFGMDLRSVPPEKIAQALESMKPLLEGRSAHQ